MLVRSIHFDGGGSEEKLCAVLEAERLLILASLTVGRRASMVEELLSHSQAKPLISQRRANPPKSSYVLIIANRMPCNAVVSCRRFIIDESGRKIRFLAFNEIPLILFPGNSDESKFIE